MCLCAFFISTSHWYYDVKFFLNFSLLQKTITQVHKSKGSLTVFISCSLFKVHFVALVILRENSCNSILAQWRNIQITNQHIPPYLAVTIFNHEWYLAITGRLGFGYIIIPPSRRLQYERVNDMSVLFTILRKWRYLAYFRFTK